MQHLFRFFVLVLTAISLAMPTQALAAPKKVAIEDGKTVQFHYKLTVDGKEYDSSEGKEPLEYVQGDGKMIHGVERGMKGLKAGDKKKIVVAVEDGYGAPDPNAIIEVPKEKFGDKPIKVGDGVTTPSPAGRPMQGIITSIGDSLVTINFNHPLAGKELTFDVEVVKVS